MANQALAGRYPVAGRQIRIVIPAPPGGSADLIARLLSQAMSAHLNGVPIIVDNKPGGATVLGASLVAKAPADGYTLLLTISSTYTQIPHLMQKLPYDPLKDFTPITQLFRNCIAVCMQPGSKARDLRDLVALSRSVGPISAASAGVGTIGHLCIEILNRNYGASFNHVPYKGAAEAQRDLQGGVVQVYFDSVSSAIPHVRSGRVKVLAVTGSARVEALPEVPHCVELGFGELDMVSWYGVFGPAGIPQGVVDTLHRALVAGLKTPEAASQLRALGAEITGTAPEAFERIVRADHATWGKVIKDAGIRLE